MNKYSYEAYRYALVVLRNKQGKFLCIKQNLNKGWWIVGGKVRLNQTFLEAAIRQCKQQTLITPKIKGIIRVDYGRYYTQNCLRCVYYAQPNDQIQKPKSIPDNQSAKAQFLTLQQILSLQKQWRGPEIYQFPKYLSQGKQIHPLSIFVQNFNC